MNKKYKKTSKSLAISATIYALSVATTVYLFTIDDGKRNWLELLTGVVIPSLVLLYIAYSFRPKSDKLGILLYAIFALVGVGIISFIVNYILTIIAVRIG